MLGCGMAPMTTMHAVKETVGDMFLSEDTREYTLILADGKEIPQTEVTPLSPPTGNGKNLWVWAAVALIAGSLVLANKKRSNT